MKAAKWLIVITLLIWGAICQGIELLVKKNTTAIELMSMLIILLLYALMHKYEGKNEQQN